MTNHRLEQLCDRLKDGIRPISHRLAVSSARWDAEAPDELVQKFEQLLIDTQLDLEHSKLKES